MDFPVARRKVNTYGKGARKIRVHDLFDVGAQPLFGPTITIKHRAPTPPRQSQTVRAFHHEAEGEVRHKMVYDTDGTTEADTVTTSSPPPTPHDPSDMFDIHSSEDDLGKPNSKRPLKKRKIVTLSSDRLKGDPKSMTGMKAVGAKPRSKSSPTLSNLPKSNMLQAKSINAKAVAANSKIDMSPPSSKRQTSVTKSARQTSTSRPSSPRGAAVSKTYRSKNSRASSGSSVDLSDASTRSHASQPSTPKRKRGVFDESLTSPNPSDIHLNSLRLTPGSGSQRSHVSSEDEEMVGAPFSHVRKGRARLIDRLDAPTKNSAEHSMRVATVKREAAQSLVNPAVSKLVSTGAPMLAKDAHDKESTSTSVAPSGRQRATYAKQRSYLSDMVDSSDNGLATLISQPSSQHNHSQALSLTSMVSQVDIDMYDSDEPDSFSQIKSIHELRRGGAVKKFDLELQTILEDIESASNSMRITGLLQLADKLHENTVLRHFHDSGNFQRLLDCVKEGLDEVSAAFFAVVFQSVVSGESSSPRVLLQVLDALYMLPTRLISERRPLSKLAKDRSQNVSKLLAKDIADFESSRTKILGQGSLSVDKILLGAIESAQRKLISHKEPLPRLPRTILDEMLSTFTEMQKHALVGGGPATQLDSLRLLLSLLEIACANHELAGSSLSASRIHDLGQTVSGVMRDTREAHADMEHSCLRLIVSLSNNDAEVCMALSRGALISTVFEVVDDHFLTLAGLAALEKDFDNARLESVILAVGCLLNLAECADVAREKMLTRQLNGRSLTHQLVDIFNSHVDQANEVSTVVRQAQFLILTAPGLDHGPNANTGSLRLHLSITVHTLHEPYRLQPDRGTDQRRQPDTVVRCRGHLPPTPTNS